ncbi:hypothetical protein GCM10028826_13710 [Mucilaginibacter boryungensis]
MCAFHIRNRDLEPADGIVKSHIVLGFTLPEDTVFLRFINLSIVISGLLKHQIYGLHFLAHVYYQNVDYQYFKLKNNPNFVNHVNHDLALNDNLSNINQ